jgi:hypothetical protein
MNVARGTDRHGGFIGDLCEDAVAAIRCTIQGNTRESARGGLTPKPHTRSHQVQMSPARAVGSTVQSTYPNTGHPNTCLPSTQTPSAGPLGRKYAEGWTPSCIPALHTYTIGPAPTGMCWGRYLGCDTSGLEIECIWRTEYRGVIGDLGKDAVTAIRCAREGGCDQASRERERE